MNATQAAGPVNGSNYPGPAEGLSTNGKDTVDTGRYLITAKENELMIYDKGTDTWAKAWGDPHLITSDGDKGQFHENLTIDLPDGTKVTIQVTEKNAKGIALIDSVAVMKCNEAVVMEGFSDGEAGVKMGNVLNNAYFVDQSMEDGTVMVAGKQVDDLSFAADGSELIGTDPNAKWGEFMLDGKGGVSINCCRPPIFPPPICRGPIFKVPPPCDMDRFPTVSEPGVSGGSIWATLWDILGELNKSLEEEVNRFDQDVKSGKYKYQEGDKLPDGKVVGDFKSDTAEQEVNRRFSDIQRLQDFMTQLMSTMTNIQKTQHDTNMAITGNLR